MKSSLLTVAALFLVGCAPAAPAASAPDVGATVPVAVQGTISAAALVTQLPTPTVPSPVPTSTRAPGVMVYQWHTKNTTGTLYPIGTEFKLIDNWSDDLGYVWRNVETFRDKKKGWIPGDDPGAKIYLNWGEEPIPTVVRLPIVPSATPRSILPSAEEAAAIEAIYSHEVPGTGRTAGLMLRELMDAAGNLESQWDAVPLGNGYRVTALLTEHGSSKTLALTWITSQDGSFCAENQRAHDLTPDVRSC